MNITKSTLRKIILEELSSLIESDFEWLSDDGRPNISDDERIEQATENFRKKRNTKFEHYEFESLEAALAQKYSWSEAREMAKKIKAEFEAEEATNRNNRFQALSSLEQEAYKKYRSNYRRGNVKNATIELVNSVGIEKAAEMLRTSVDTIASTISDEMSNF